MFLTRLDCKHGLLIGSSRSIGLGLVRKCADVAVSYPRPHKLVEEGGRLCRFQSVANPGCLEPIERIGRVGELQVHVNVHGYCDAERIYVTEVDGIGRDMGAA